MRDEMLKITPKGKHDEDVNMNEVMDENNTAVSTENPQLYNDSSYPYSRELNMHENPETRDEMLKTTPEGKHNEDVNVNNMMDGNNTAASTENPQLYNDSYYQYSTSKQVADILIKEVNSNLVEKIKRGNQKNLRS
jgi:hypothetical protein